MTVRGLTCPLGPLIFFTALFSSLAGKIERVGSLGASGMQGGPLPWAGGRLEGLGAGTAGQRGGLHH